ncbi:hypothetical protein [Allomesorhizobium alhagi]|uniref:Uncharacterized protein n=1 Tax=Mesorhizobium alhagi CCNWXJ12-2 TaxID=1107882 RepID=H0HYP9_9HYPH|nr:hypothetical protein [Mesorhizobium alhagi]EHK54146.1 hypothetical protein MAXJ12_26658 [Mesorhizobium alhagi CCNWXJ12-2]
MVPTAKFCQPEFCQPESLLAATDAYVANPKLLDRQGRAGLDLLQWKGQFNEVS